MHTICDTNGEWMWRVMSIEFSARFAVHGFTKERIENGGTCYTRQRWGEAVWVVVPAADVKFYFFV